MNVIKYLICDDQHNYTGSLMESIRSRTTEKGMNMNTLKQLSNHFAPWLMPKTENDKGLALSVLKQMKSLGIVSICFAEKQLTIDDAIQLVILHDVKQG